MWYSDFYPASHPEKSLGQGGAPLGFRCRSHSSNKRRSGCRACVSPIQLSTPISRPAVGIVLRSPGRGRVIASGTSCANEKSPALGRGFGCLVVTRSGCWMRSCGHHAVQFHQAEDIPALPSSNVCAIRSVMAASSHSRRACGSSVGARSVDVSGSTLKPRTLVKGRKTPNPVWRSFAAFGGYGTARYIRTHPLLPHRMSGTLRDRRARA